MRILEGDYWSWVPLESGTAVAIGVFDGVHRGHRTVLEELKRRAAELGGLPSTVLTFDRHPLTLVAPDRAPSLLTTVEQRLEIFADIGIDTAAVLTYDEKVRDIDPESFAADVLAAALGASVVVVGANFRYGRGRTGTTESLRTFGLGLGFYVHEVDIVGGDRALSSTGIREAVVTGDVLAAEAGLGRWFELRGTVVPGDARGRLVGFPTANLDVDPHMTLPADGVYAVWIGDGERTHRGVVNIGVRPTFGGSRRVVEAHLIDYEGDLYGRELRLAFVARLRGEQRFSGIDELRAQIGADIEAGQQALSAGS